VNHLDTTDDRRPSRSLRAAGLVALLLIGWLGFRCLWLAPPVHLFDLNRSLCLSVFPRGTTTPGTPVVIVAAGRESWTKEFPPPPAMPMRLSAEMSQWTRIGKIVHDLPWLSEYYRPGLDWVDDGVLARAVDRLTGCGARLVVLNGTFEGEQAEELVRSSARSGRVLAARTFTPDMDEYRVIQPDPKLAGAVSALGYPDIVSDPDGVVRGAVLQCTVNGQTLRHLALQSAIKFLDDPEVSTEESGLVLRNKTGRDSLLVPLTREGLAIPNDLNMSAYRRLTLKDVSSDSADTEALRRAVAGAIVVVSAVPPLETSRYLRRPVWTGSAHDAVDMAECLAMLVEGILTDNLFRDGRRVSGCWPLLILLGFGVVAWIQPPFRVLGISLALAVVIALVTLVLFRFGILVNGVGLNLAVGLLCVARLAQAFVSHQLKLLSLSREVERELRCSWLKETLKGRPTDDVAGEVHTHTVEDSIVRRYVSSRYGNLEFLAAGGMGLVYKAFDSSRGTTVAVKILSPMLQSASRIRRRFLAEAETLRRLDHPGLVKVLDVCTDALTFFSMELVTGQSLKQILSKEGSMPALRAMHIAREIAGIVAHIHGNGVVHRDVKPSNIMLLDGDTVKLLDFGVAHDLSRTEMTTSGDVLGTYVYMAPEQFSGAAVTPAVDVYAIALVLCEMLIGKIPERRGAIHSSPAALLKDGAVPDPVLELIERCLLVTPESRPADGGALLKEIEALIPVVKGGA